jgi:hypothetical protein
LTSQSIVSSKATGGTRAIPATASESMAADPAFLAQIQQVGGTAGPMGRMSVCRASVGGTPRSFGSRLHDALSAVVNRDQARIGERVRAAQRGGQRHLDMAEKHCLARRFRAHPPYARSRAGLRAQTADHAGHVSTTVGSSTASCLTVTPWTSRTEFRAKLADKPTQSRQASSPRPQCSAARSFHDLRACPAITRGEQRRRRRTSSRATPARPDSSPVARRTPAPLESSFRGRGPVLSPSATMSRRTLRDRDAERSRRTTSFAFAGSPLAGEPLGRGELRAVAKSRADHGRRRPPLPSR